MTTSNATQQVVSRRPPPEAEHNDQRNNNDNNHDSDTNTGDDVASALSNADNYHDLIQLPEEDFLEPWVDFIKRATRAAEEAT